jgi:hypothetical protein
MKVCVLAITTSMEKTSKLIQAQSTRPQLVAGDIWRDWYGKPKVGL